MYGVRFYSIYKLKASRVLSARLFISLFMSSPDRHNFFVKKVIKKLPLFIPFKLRQFPTAQQLGKSPLTKDLISRNSNCI